jgi:hypothetical protein
VKPSQGSGLHQLNDAVGRANRLGRLRRGCELDGPDFLGGRDVLDEVLWPLHLDQLQHPDLPGFHEIFRCLMHLLPAMLLHIILQLDFAYGIAALLAALPALVHQPELVVLVLLYHGLRIVLIVHLQVALFERPAHRAPQGPPEVLLQLIHFIVVYVTLFFISDFVIARSAAAHTAEDGGPVLLEIQMLLLTIPRLRVGRLLLGFMRSDEGPEGETLLQQGIFVGPRR